MTDTVQKVAYYKTTVSNRPGAGARVLGALRAAGVNLLAFHAFPAGKRAQLDFVPKDAGAFTRAARKAGIKLGPKKTAFLVTGRDRRGAVAQLLGKLGESGISVTALTGVHAGGGRFGAIFWVDPKDVKKTAKTLGAR